MNKNQKTITVCIIILLWFVPLYILCLLTGISVKEFLECTFYFSSVLFAAFGAHYIANININKTTNNFYANTLPKLKEVSVLSKNTALFVKKYI